MSERRDTLLEVAEIAQAEAAKAQRRLKPQAESGKPSVAYRIARSEADAWQSIRDRVLSIAAREGGDT